MDFSWSEEDLNFKRIRILEETLISIDVENIDCVKAFSETMS